MIYIPIETQLQWIREDLEMIKKYTCSYENAFTSHTTITPDPSFSHFHEESHDLPKTWTVLKDGEICTFYLRNKDHEQDE